MLALSQEYFNLYYKASSPTTSEFDVDEGSLRGLLAKYEHLNRVITQEKLGSVHLVKPVLDGKQICEMYGIKPGKALKGLIEETLRF